MELLKNQTIDTTGSQDTEKWKGGKGTVLCEGTFDGATVSLEASYDDGEWVPCGADTSFTEAGLILLELSSGFILRGSVSSAGGSTDVSLTVIVSHYED